MFLCFPAKESTYAYMLYTYILFECKRTKHTSNLASGYRVCFSLLALNLKLNNNNK